MQALKKNTALKDDCALCRPVRLCKHFLKSIERVNQRLHNIKTFLAFLSGQRKEEVKSSYNKYLKLELMKKSRILSDLQCVFEVGILISFNIELSPFLYPQ